jgi:hypothetical protein
MKGKWQKYKQQQVAFKDWTQNLDSLANKINSKYKYIYI